MPTSFSITFLLERIFQRFSSNSSSKNIGELFVELDALLSPRVVQAALHLLDHHTIVIYHNHSKTKEIAEISEGQQGSSKLIHLFPHINYCTCEYFEQEVLGKVNTPVTPYTCEHVLALRLAFLLKSEKLRFEELPSNKLKLLLSHFMPEDGNSD